MSKGSFTQDPQSTAGLRRPGGHLSALAGAWRKLQEWMQSTVVSPGLRFTASHAADTAALRGSRIIHQMKPCHVSLMDPASPLHERAGENPQPHTSIAKWCYQGTSVLQRCIFPSLTQATFKSLYDSFTGKDYKDSFNFVQGSTEQMWKRK